MDDLITCAVFEQQNCLHTDAPDYFLDRILRIQPDLRKGIYKMNFGSKIFDSDMPLSKLTKCIILFSPDDVKFCSPLYSPNVARISQPEII